MAHFHEISDMRIEGFDLKRSLGAGATSEVFEAVNLTTGDLVALKVFSQAVAKDPESLHRLDAEVEALECIRHPNTVQLKGKVKSQEWLALELELVRGQDLRVWSESLAMDLLEPKYWILAQIARGLGAAHEIGILHRDLKPENILVSDAGISKVTDFGLARSISRATLTRLGLLIGSLGYMAPEVINQDRPTILSDIFSFGVVAYELLSGISPFQTETPQSLVRSISEGAVVPISQRVPHLPREIAEMITGCLSVDPKRRPSNIWTIEAILMSELLASDMLGWCPRLASKFERTDALPGALEHKHKILKKKLEALTLENKDNPSKIVRESLIQTAREMSRLFPEDEGTMAALTQMAKPARRERGLLLYAATAVLIGFLALSGWTMFHARPFRVAIMARPAAMIEPPPAIAATQTPPPSTEPVLPSATPATTPPKKARHKQPAEVTPIRDLAIQLPKKPMPKGPPMGEIHFIIENDVDAYVDGTFVTNDQLQNFRASAGPHAIKLVKNGYRPIERTVTVVDGESTFVRTKKDSANER